ncbi:MAG TPA: hypothetical protein PLP29_01295 [Candidatus Ozemobacteraceae bacterium]|nr:hypothetical protein [Candidatus Ozemobacteraceae bacterium]
MSSFRTGSAFLMLLFGVILLSLLGYMAARSSLAPATGSGPSPIDRSFTAVCAANKALITQQLQMYAINHDPMTKLDLPTLFAPGSFQAPHNAPCSYTLDVAGRVICSAHP